MPVINVSNLMCQSRYIYNANVVQCVKCCVHPSNIDQLFTMKKAVFYSTSELKICQCNFQKWYDPRFVWSKEEYQGVDTVIIPPQKAWLPDIALHNWWVCL